MKRWSSVMAFMRGCTACKWARRYLAKLSKRCRPALSKLREQLEPVGYYANARWSDYKTWIAAREVVRHDRQFQPAVLELQDNPASPTARLFLQGILAIIILALLWSVFGRIDIIAAGHGKIIPTGRVKVIQPLEAGVIKVLHIEEGQTVRQGDVLVELDVTQTEADKERLGGEKDVLEADIARLKALLNDEAMPDFKALPEHLAALQAGLFIQLAEKRAAEVAVLEEELAARFSERSDAEQQIKRLNASVGLLNKRSARIKKLVDEGFYARNRYDLDETERLRMTRELESQRERLVQSKAGIAGAEQKLSAAKAEFQRVLLAELAEKQERYLVVSKELDKADQRNRLQTLVAPISGTIQEVKVHTLGGVVTPAQELMKVVPFEDALEAEVLIPNKDIGFVHAGQDVAVKLEAYPFTKYGMIDGEVKSISLDAISDEKLGLVYAARIKLKQSTLDIGEKTIVLGPGLAVSAEVKTGSRRIIEYFLSPIAEYAGEAIRER